MRGLWRSCYQAARNGGIPLFLAEIIFFYLDFVRMPIWRAYRISLLASRRQVPKFSALRYDTFYYLPGLLIVTWIYFLPIPCSQLGRTILMSVLIWRLLGLFVSQVNAAVLEPYRDSL